MALKSVHNSLVREILVHSALLTFRVKMEPLVSLKFILRGKLRIL